MAQPHAYLGQLECVQDTLTSSFRDAEILIMPLIHLQDIVRSKLVLHVLILMLLYRFYSQEINYR